MQNRVLHLTLAAVFLVAGSTACGGSKTSAKRASTSTPATTSAKPTTTAPQATFKAVFTAASHHPVVNKNWPITVTVTDLSGKPIAATLQMNVLFGGLQVGQIDNGKIYHFVGRHHENITWPARAVGTQLVLQSVIKVNGKTKKLLWPLSVVPK